MCYSVTVEKRGQYPLDTPSLRGPKDTTLVYGTKDAGSIPAGETLGCGEAGLTPCVNASNADNMSVTA
jgi:hypothetical protein